MHTNTHRCKNAISVCIHFGTCLFFSLYSKTSWKFSQAFNTPSLLKATQHVIMWLPLILSNLGVVIWQCLGTVPSCHNVEGVGCYWLLPSEGQGCRQISYSVLEQQSPTPVITENFLVLNASTVEAENLGLTNRYEVAWRSYPVALLLQLPSTSF